jgi:hypothetical protein
LAFPVNDVKPGGHDHANPEPRQGVRKIAENRQAENRGGNNLKIMQGCQGRRWCEFEGVGHGHVADGGGKPDAETPQPEYTLRSHESKRRFVERITDYEERQADKTSQPGGVKLH